MPKEALPLEYRLKLRDDVARLCRLKQDQVNVWSEADTGRLFVQLDVPGRPMICCPVRMAECNGVEHTAYWFAAEFGTETLPTQPTGPVQ